MLRSKIYLDRLTLVGLIKFEIILSNPNHLDDGTLDGCCPNDLSVSLLLGQAIKLAKMANQPHRLV